MPIVYALAVLGVMGAVFGALLTVASKVFYVETDPRAEQIAGVVAGANCGACGFAGCDAFSKAVVEGKAPVNGCLPGGKGTAEAVAEIMGVKAETADPKWVQVLCQGTTECAKERYKYDGLQSCAMAATLAQGPKECRFSCIGQGDCVRACAFDAMHLKDGIAKVDYAACVSCGACVKACPRDIIQWAPRESKVHVRCQSREAAKPARTACTAACIACKRCEKACQFDAIHVTDNLARIDYSKCTSCGECVKVCPDKCITIQS